MIRKSAYHFLHYWFPILFYCLIIFVQSSYPRLESTPDLPHMDKVLHFAGYALLGMLLLRGLSHSRFKDHDRLIKVASIVLTGIYGAIYGISSLTLPVGFLAFISINCSWKSIGTSGVSRPLVHTRANCGPKGVLKIPCSLRPEQGFKPTRKRRPQADRATLQIWALPCDPP
jgi:hypothetical protein